MDVLTTLQKLPEKSFAVLPSDPCQVIGIHRGVPGYTPLKRHARPEAAAAQVARLHAGGNVNEYQAEAMLAGSMFGWHVPGADPDTYRKSTPKRLGMDNITDDDNGEALLARRHGAFSWRWLTAWI